MAGAVQGGAMVPQSESALASTMKKDIVKRRNLGSRAKAGGRRERRRKTQIARKRARAGGGRGAGQGGVGAVQGAGRAWWAHHD